jgi:hypothetical protein
MKCPWTSLLVVVAAVGLARCASVAGPRDQDSGATSDDARRDVPTPGDNGRYGAAVIIGGLDRIRVTRADDAAGTCDQLILVSPSGGGGTGLTGIHVPMGWSLESATRSGRIADCDAMATVGGAGERATSGVGEITATMSSATGFPCRLELNVDLAFPDGTSQMRVTGLQVMGACP